MKVAVIPDAAMIVVPLIEKNGHEYISPTNFSKYNNMDVSGGKCDDTQAPYTLNWIIFYWAVLIFQMNCLQESKVVQHYFPGFWNWQMRLLSLEKDLIIIKKCMMY